MTDTPTGTYEMLWDCPACQTTGLLGLTHRYCPHCGAAQDPTKRYFPADDQKVAVENHRYVGADRLCPACGSPGSAIAQYCGGCGSPMADGKTVTTRPDEAEGPDGQFRPVNPAPPPAKRGIPGWTWKLGGVLVLILLASVAWFWKREAVVTVASHSWERRIDIEVFRQVSETAWCDEKPADAYHVHSYRAQRSTREIPDGQTCHTVRHDNGDGSFSESESCQTRYRSEPVYSDRCDYTVDRWRVDRAVSASGLGIQPDPVWPAVTLRQPGMCLGCDREGAHHEHYIVELARTDGGKPWHCDLPQAQWTAMADASRWQVQVRTLLDMAVCRTLKPAF